MEPFKRCAVRSIPTAFPSCTHCSSSVRSAGDSLRKSVPTSRRRSRSSPTLTSAAFRSSSGEPVPLSHGDLGASIESIDYVLRGHELGHTQGLLTEIDDFPSRTAKLQNSLHNRIDCE